MLEILENFESAMSGTERLSPSVLIGPGVAAVIAGLFVWLGGLGLKRLLAAIAGAICGGILASVAIGLTVVPTAASIAVGLVVAMVFEKVFVTALAAGLATAAGAAFFIGPYMQISPVAELVRQDEDPSQATTLSGGQSISKIRAWIINVRGAVGQACSQMPAHKWALTAVLGLVVVAGGSFFWRLTAALYFSSAGTILVFAGMILLLFYKGVMPVSRICRRPSLYSGLFAVMVAFGTAEQLLLCRSGKTPSDKKQTGANSSKSERK
ncbi:MAG TPA: hypothetical protein ENI81_00950 [Phycisphaerales bacterium]|nr:hypothetical protein [Phycisphaerales bacterium]